MSNNRIIPYMVKIVPRPSNPQDSENFGLSSSVAKEAVNEFPSTEEPSQKFSLVRQIFSQHKTLTSIRAAIKEQESRNDCIINSLKNPAKEQRLLHFPWYPYVYQSLDREYKGLLGEYFVESERAINSVSNAYAAKIKDASSLEEQKGLIQAFRIQMNEVFGNIREDLQNRANEIAMLFESELGKLDFNAMSLLQMPPSASELQKQLTRDFGNRINMIQEWMDSTRRAVTRELDFGVNKWSAYLLRLIEKKADELEKLPFFSVQAA